MGKSQCIRVSHCSLVPSSLDANVLRVYDSYESTTVNSRVLNGAVE